MTGEWELVPFEQLLFEPVRNGIYKPKEFHGRGVKIVNMGELFAYPRLHSVSMKRVELNDSELKRFMLSEGDLIFARRSLTAEGAGKCSVVLELDEPTTFESSIIRARPDQEKAVPLYLYYFFNSSSGLHSLDTIRRQVAVAGITGGDLAKLPIPVPPIPEQRAIAHILGTLDDKIELNRRMNETLETIAWAIFKSWFVDFDPVRAKMSGEAPESICQRLGLTPDLLALFPDRFKDSELGEIPEGWNVTKVQEATSKIFSGGTPDTRKAEYWGGELNWCSSGETRNRFIVETEKKITQLGVDNSSTKAVVPGDILIASAGQGHTRGQTSYCAIDTFINQSVVSVRANTEKAKPLWLFYNLASRYEEMRGLSDSHSSRGSLTTKLIGGMSLIFPPFKLVKAFDDITRPLAHKQIEGAQQSVTLSMIRDALLPKLLSGELRVPVNPE